MTDKLNEMWAALATYQPKADADGHGESWALMCSERTKETAHDAANATWSAGEGATDDAGAWAAAAAAWVSASDDAADVEYHAKLSIKHITKARKKTE